MLWSLKLLVKDNQCTLLSAQANVDAIKTRISSDVEWMNKDHEKLAIILQRSHQELSNNFYSLHASFSFKMAELFKIFKDNDAKKEEVRQSKP